MNWRVRCGVVIPCLNEAKAIAELVQGVRMHFQTVLVVDDGSSDETPQLAREAGAIVLQHSQSRGKGAALTTGLRWLHERQFAWALLMDGDGQHAPEDIAAFLESAEKGGAAMLVGNRMAQAAKMPWLRRQTNWWISRRLSVLTGKELPDSQCGFRLMLLKVWAQLAIETTHFEIESEILVAFLAAGVAVEFVPVRVIYRLEQSKIRPGLDSWRWFSWWWRTKRKAKPRQSRLEERAVPGWRSTS